MQYSSSYHLSCEKDWQKHQMGAVLQIIYQKGALLQLFLGESVFLLQSAPQTSTSTLRVTRGTAGSASDVGVFGSAQGLGSTGGAPAAGTTASAGHTPPSPFPHPPASSCHTPQPLPTPPTPKLYIF